MMTQTTLNARSIRTFARTLTSVLIFTLSLGGAASADLADSVDTIKKKVSVIPDDGAVRKLFKQIDPAVVSQVMGIVGESQEVLDTLTEARAGLDAYKNDGGADRMRRDLIGLFADLRTLSETSQRLRCFQDPETSIVALQTDFMARSVEHMPAVALFAMQKVLDEAAPDWRTMISDILADLPVDAIYGMCETGGEIIDRFESARCEVAREINPTRMARIELKAKAAGKIFKVIQNYAAEDVQITVAAVAVGGGGGGTNVPMPSRGIMQTIINVMEKLESGAAKVQTIQGECSDADEKMERDLLSCTALASYDAQMDGIRDLAIRRLESLDASWSDLNEIQRAQSFGELCTSYKAFRMQ
jgi:hypothetical protein